MKEDVYNKRSFHHNYFKPFIYHIILKKREGFRDFGFLRGNSNKLPGEAGAPYVYLSEFGRAIVNGLKDYENKYPGLQKYHYKIMPDHIHLIVNKKKEDGIHLDDYIEWMKDLIIEKFNGKYSCNINKEDAFCESYTDRPLYDDVSLATWFEYLDANPYRRVKILQNPDFFNRTHKIRIGEMVLETYGNIFLLDNPDKFAVRMRSFFSQQEILDHEEAAICAAEKGAVLVSPFISPKEKIVRDKAMENGARFIKIQQQGFSDRFKPYRHDFELCGQGRMLIISLGFDPKLPISHHNSTIMNEIAAEIAKGNFSLLGS